MRKHKHVETYVGRDLWLMGRLQNEILAFGASAGKERSTQGKTSQSWVESQITLSTVGAQSTIVGLGTYRVS